jgi:hypothetical protein
MEKRRPEILPDKKVDCARTNLEQAGDNVVLHSNKLSTRIKNSLRIPDGDGFDLSRRLEDRVHAFEKTVDEAKSLERIKGLSLSVYTESSGYGVDWHVSIIRGILDEQKIELYSLDSTDYVNGGPNREVRWSKVKGYVNGREVSEEVINGLYSRVSWPLSMRNRAEDRFPERIPSCYRNAEEWFKRISAPHEAIVEKQGK